MEFMMLQDLECPETESVYCAGMSYTLRSPGEYADPAAKARCEALAVLVPQWVEQGKAVLGRSAPAEVQGG